MGGKLKIGGNVMLAQKLKALFDANKGSVGKGPVVVPAAAPAAALKTNLKVCHFIYLFLLLLYYIIIYYL